LFGRTIPLHDPTYRMPTTHLTEEQVLAELREAGMPIELIKHMRDAA
jgi:hypothetical protein